MKETTIFNSSINLYNNSTNLNLFESIKGFFKENNNNSSEKKIKFFKELSKVLEDKLILTIRLHQIGYNNIRQKLLSEKNFILNSLSAEVKNMTINQFIQFLKSLKEQPQDKHFSIGKNIINNNRIPMEINNKIFCDKDSNNNKNNILKPLIDTKNLPFPNNMNNKNYNSIKTSFDPRKLHSPSPPPQVYKTVDSKILNVYYKNDKINFNEPQNLN